MARWWSVGVWLPLLHADPAVTGMVPATTYVGTRLGVTATVTRTDATHATLTLRTGPVSLASGAATWTPADGLVLDDGLARTLHARGVSVVSVRPCDDHIDVCARVRLLGEVPIRLHRVG